MTAARPDVAVVGSVNVDLVASVAHLPLPGETVLAQDLAQLVGGKGANQAVAAARLGRRVALVGLTGADAEGATVRAALEREGVDVAHLGVAPEAPTGRALVLVADDAENSIVVVGGANAALGEDHVRAASPVVGGAAVVVAQLEVPLGPVLAAARAATGTVLLNAAPAREVPRELLDHVDVLVVNELEYATVLGRPVPDDLADLAGDVARRGLRGAVVVTLGARGAALVDDGRVLVESAPRVPVVDTTGAGDTFVGALADALSRELPLRQALRWAVHAAALAVGALGATTAMPTAGQVRASLPAVDPGAP